MNELRWILLGIGLLIIGGIYYWESVKQKRKFRSRIEIYPSFDKNNIANIKVHPEKGGNMDIAGALAAFNAYLKQAKKYSVDTAPGPAGPDVIPGNDQPRPAPAISRPLPADAAREQIIQIYITAESTRQFTGPDLLQALESADMHHGAMKIFHYHGPDKKHATRALFSLANIHEPGTFEIDAMERFTTNGLVLFMQLPAEIGGDIAFEIMLDTAHNLAYLLGGELRGADRKPLDTEGLSRLREIASHY